MNQAHHELLSLPVPEKLQLIQELWDSIAASPEHVPLPDWQKSELDRRKAAYLQNPNIARSWEDVKSRIRGES